MMQHSNSDEDLLLDNLLAHRDQEYEPHNYAIAEATEPDEHNSLIKEPASGVDSLIMGASQNDDIHRFVIQTPIVLVNQVRSTQPETSNPETDLSMEAKYKEAR